ncbi:MAG: VWA domain-containing protein [Verrucomicrobiales bacterium]|nr:VWA domain-containing protein [Verrucomicrobiales bacterium]
MNFLAPTAFAFAAALPVVVVFYLLKRKRVVKLVPSTLLWQKFLAETQASAPFQKLRHNWLLILQLLLLAFIVFALSRPYFTGEIQTGGLQVVILDASASMQSTDIKPSRFEQARTEALALVDGMGDHDQMAVLLTGAGTEVKQSPTSNKTALRRALRSCAVTDAPGRMIEALRLAQSLTRDRTDASIHLLSDGALTGLDEFENEGLNLVYHRVGEDADNRGIVAMDVRSHPEDPTRQAVFATVMNVSTNAASARLELLFAGRMLESRTVSFGPRESVSQVFGVEQQQDGVYELRVASEDELAADNAAWVMARLPQPARVLLVTGGNRFLEKAIATQPRVELSVTATLTEDPTTFDITILDNVAPAVWPTGNVLAFRSAPTNWVEVAGTLEGPGIVDWKNTHPLLRFINLDNVAIGEALQVHAAPWAIPLVESASSPLMLAGELDQRRIVWVAFDPLQSTWPLRVSFPIFIANAIEWLNPAARESEQFKFQPGSPLRLTVPPGITAVTVTPPEAAAETLPLPAGSREFVFGNTPHRGVYQLQAGTNTTFYCANLLDPRETDITPQAEIALGRYARAEATLAQAANLELWRWIAAIGLAILMFEWWWYHKRTA